MDWNETSGIIEKAFENIKELNNKKDSEYVIEVVEKTIEALNRGVLRVAEQRGPGDWITHQWLKKAILLYFRLKENEIYRDGVRLYFDKIPQKFSDYTSEKFKSEHLRIVPGAVVRYGSYIAKNVILMPSFVNIGAYIDEGTMIDTWATIGSCAQIGKNVHISGGVGIGGVLEPVQSSPVIIEDNVFIGARSEIVEGVIIEKNSVISMGVYIGKSTRIYDRASGEIFYGRVPAGSVVVPGTLPSSDGKYSLYCAVIVKKVDEKTLSKIGINDLLRDIQ